MKILRSLFIVVVVAFGTVGLARFWYAYPHAFPAPLRWLAVRLILRDNPEATAGLEQLYVLVVSLIVVLLITSLVVLALKRRR